MNSLPGPVRHHYSAADGWWMLGNLNAALEELGKISGSYRSHPRILELSWKIEARRQQWESALSIATLMVQNTPACPVGWIFKTYSVRRYHGVQPAYNLLIEAVHRYPQEPIIPYNLACYACEFGRLREARRWLQLACRLGNDLEIKLIALKDSDLEAIWGEIVTWS